MSSAKGFTAGPAQDVIRKLADFFSGRAEQVWATGGFLRDRLLDREVHDIDIAVSGDTLAIGRELADALGGHFFPLREERGQARILLPDERLHIDLMPLRAADIESDLGLRDYTVDALAAPLSGIAEGKENILDPTGGLEDLRTGRVRMTGEQAFRDDSLRLLRGPRIATELGFEIEASTAQAIHRHAKEITAAAPERRRDELIRICSTGRAGQGFRLLESLGLFAHLFPEMDPARGLEQPKEHYFDVFGHSLAAVEALDWLLAPQPPAGPATRSMWEDLWGQLAWCAGLRDYFAEEVVSGTTRSALLKFCGLLHDIAKPQTKSIQENGRVRFFGHSELGAEMARGLMRRLRFSSREIALVGAMIEAHLRPLQLAQSGPPTKRAVYRFFRDTEGAGIDTLFLSLGDHLASVGPRVSADDFRRHVALISYILHVRYTEGERVSSPKLVNGDTLMRELRLEPGPLLGELLQAVREAQEVGEIETPDRAIELARSLLAQKRNGERQ